MGKDRVFKWINFMVVLMCLVILVSNEIKRCDGVSNMLSLAHKDLKHIGGEIDDILQLSHWFNSIKTTLESADHCYEVDHYFITAYLFNLPQLDQGLYCRFVREFVENGPLSVYVWGTFCGVVVSAVCLYYMFILLVLHLVNPYESRAALSHMKVMYPEVTTKEETTLKTRLRRMAFWMS